jgi:hypothetical protein
MWIGLSAIVIAVAISLDEAERRSIGNRKPGGRHGDADRSAAAAESIR